MRKLLLAVLFLCCSVSFAQLYISSNKVLLNKNALLYVRQDINLQTNAALYLREQGQLVQGTTGASANKGTGVLSVFQEGTVNNFAYNYWCSPVGNASAATGNESFGISMLGRPTSYTATTPATFASGPNGTANPLAISPYWIYKYVSSATYSQWTSVGTASSIAAGEGFTMKGTSGTDNTVVEGNAVQNNPGSAQRYDFRGKPNDGTISVSIAPGKYTLTGNPYPSALHVNAFLLDPANTASTAIAYYWEQDKTVNSHNVAQYKGGYGTYAPVSTNSAGVYVPATFNTYNADGSVNTVGSSSGLNIERRYAPIGQGFMIQGSASGTAVSLKNAHRVYYKESTTPYSYFARNPPSPPGMDSLDIASVSNIRLDVVMNNLYTRQLALAFMPEATDGVDWGIDAPSPSDSDYLPEDAFFYLDNSKYVIEGINFDVSKRIKLGVKASSQVSFTFKLSQVLNFDMEQDVFLYDAADNTYHNLKTNDYTVMLNAGTYTNRFEVTFMENQLGLPEHTAIALEMVQDNSRQELAISNPQNLQVTSVNLYDMAGKLVLEHKELTSEESFTVRTYMLQEGIYIARVIAHEGTFSRKIAIRRQ